jgi:hypothetical protein
MQLWALLQHQQRPQMPRSIRSSLLSLQHRMSASTVPCSLTLRMIPGAPSSSQRSPAVLMQTRQATQQAQQVSQLMAAATTT